MNKGFSVNRRMENQVVLVTGSSRGIGRGIANDLAKEGAKIAVNYVHQEDKAREIVEEIEEGRHNQKAA